MPASYLWNSKINEKHHCAIKSDESKSFLPPLPPHPTFWQRFRRAFKKSTLISEKNPQSTEYYRSKSEILYVRKAHVEANSFIIHPFSMFRVYYEMYMAVMWFYILVYASLDAAFDVFFNYFEGGNILHTFNFINLWPNLVCIVDIILNFFTGYAIKTKRKVIMKPSKIAKNYIFSYLFVCDAISSIPEPWFIQDTNVQRGVDILGFLKIVRIPTFYHYMLRSGEYLKINYTTIQIVSTGLFGYIIFHWIACFHFFVPQIRYYMYGEYERNSWPMRTNILAQSTQSKYIHSFYRISAAMLCVNFDDQPLYLWEEKMFFIVTFLFGKVFIFYVDVVILHYLLNRSSLEIKYFETISQVKSFMTQKHLSLPMQKRLLQFYDYKYNRKYFKEDSITGLLSDRLKGEINISVRSKVVQNVALLANLPDKILEQVVSSLTTEIYLPNDIIIKAGSFGDCMYFLSSGTVSVWTPSGKEICHLQDGAYFGEICLVLKDQKRTATIVAVEICEVYKLDRKVFKNCFKVNTALFKLLEDVANERLEITQKYEDLYAKKFMEEFNVHGTHQV